MREHRLIERIVPVLQREMDRMRREDDISPVFLKDIVDFFRIYTDRLHHGKEKEILFKVLATKSLHPEFAQTMRELTADHARGRELVQGLELAAAQFMSGDREAVGRAIDAMEHLASLYPRHIDEEDRHFFYPCLAYLDDTEQAEMLERFEDIDREVLHEKYRDSMSSLEQGPELVAAYARSGCHRKQGCHKHGRQSGAEAGGPR